MFTLKELQGFADVGEHCGSVSGKPFVVNLDPSDELILANTLAACDIASIESVDVIDNVYEFMLHGDSPFNVHYSDDDDNELVQHYDIKDSIWLVSIGECFIDNGIYRYCRITCASKNVMFRPDLILRTAIDDQRDAYSSYTMDVKATGILHQVSLKIKNIVHRADNIKIYNDSLDSIIPADQFTYYAPRSIFSEYKVLPESSESDVANIKNILTSHVEDDIWKGPYGKVEISPYEYVRAWVVAHSRKPLDGLSDDDITSYFLHNNCKGYALLDRLHTPEDWQNISILDSWINENSCFHCTDVIYARTILSVYGTTLVYSNNVGYYTDEFLTSILALDKHCSKNALVIRDVKRYLDMIDGKDYIKLVPAWPDKYFRNYKTPNGAPCYMEYCYESENISLMKGNPSVIRSNEFCSPIKTHKDVMKKRIND